MISENNDGLKKTKKIYYGYYNSYDSTPHPVIRIEGKYLESFGFLIGESINVVIDKEQILIKKISPTTKPGS